LENSFTTLPDGCKQLLEMIRRNQPLIHHITNRVTIHDCAQITRATGALPVMAHMQAEVEEMAALASALVLNIGTLTSDTVESMTLAGLTANQNGIPVVLDMVGCGATRARTQAVKDLLTSVKIAIIKGNPGEIGSAHGVQAEVKGVESISVAGDIGNIAKDFASTTKAVVVVTGETDLITDGQQLHLCCEGHPLMGQLVGTGCMAASVLGAFAAVANLYLDAAFYAMTFYGTAGHLPVSLVLHP
jgi:hydroxyethylthiazole kinase